MDLPSHHCDGGKLHRCTDPRPDPTCRASLPETSSRPHRRPIADPWLARVALPNVGIGRRGRANRTRRRIPERVRVRDEPQGSTPTRQRGSDPRARHMDGVAFPPQRRTNSSPVPPRQRHRLPSNAVATPPLMPRQFRSLRPPPRPRPRWWASDPAPEHRAHALDARGTVTRAVDAGTRHQRRAPAARPGERARTHGRPVHAGCQDDPRPPTDAHRGATHHDQHPRPRP